MMNISATNTMPDIPISRSTARADAAPHSRAEPRIDIVIPCAGRMHDLLRLLESIHLECAGSLAAHGASITTTDDANKSSFAFAVPISIFTASQLRLVFVQSNGPINRCAPYESNCIIKS